ncbi:MAG: phosphatase PAP2 family protein [Bacteroidales bacterium]|jgi:undecaprenyl-diphosphatase|nr:phosphatase PAP2 family protein [Bacteroidales bacterium]
MNWLLELDRDIFLFLNGLHAPWLDHVMWWISQTKTWIPLYLVLLILIIYKERRFRFLYTLLFLTLTIVLADQISGLIKDLVERPRPTRNVEIGELVHTVKGYRGGAYGFVSSHAANVFAVATFLAHQIRNPKWSILLYIWAIIVSYSRIYLGVHYPLDILCGAILGVIIGIQCYIIRLRTSIFVERKARLYKEKKRKREKSGDRQ